MLPPEKVIALYYTPTTIIAVSKFMQILQLLCLDDNSRVKLTKVQGDPASDYINASFVSVSMK